MVYKMENWGFAQAVSSVQDKNLAAILDAFLLATPCGEVSRKGKSLKDLGFTDKYVKALYEEMCYSASIDSNYIKRVKIKQMKNELKDINRYEGFDDELQFIICTKKGNRANSIFHLIRNALAHGAFKIVKLSDEYYAFENYFRKKICGRAVLKTRTLIAWADLLKSKPSDVLALYEARRERQKKSKHGK